MDSSEESSTSGSSTDSHDVKNLAAAAEVLRRMKAILRMHPPLVKSSLSHNKADWSSMDEIES